MTATSWPRVLAFLPPSIRSLHSGDPREAWIDQERSLVFFGTRGQAVLHEQADAVFFVRRVSPPDYRK